MEPPFAHVFLRGSCKEARHPLISCNPNPDEGARPRPRRVTSWRGQECVAVHGLYKPSGDRRELNFGRPLVDRWGVRGGGVWRGHVEK